MKYFVVIIVLFGLNLSTSLAQEAKDFNYEYALIEAARQKTIGNINEAIKLYQKCLEAKPESDLVYYELGSIYAALNQPEISERMLKKAHELDPENYWYMLAYSQILNLKEEYRTLIKVLKDYLKSDDNSRIRYTLADAYHNLGRYNKAIKLLNRIEKERGIAEQVVLKKVEIYKDKGNNEKGEVELNKLLGIYPEAPEYNIIMAEYLEETGSVARAVKYYEKAYEMDTSNLYAISNLADYYTSNNQMDKGLYYLNRAFTLDEIKLERKLSSLVYFLGQEKLVKEHKDMFDKIINTLSSKYEESTEVKTLAYDYYAETEDFEKAYDIVKMLLEDNGDNYMLWQRAIYTASVLNRYDDMIDMGKRALKIFPNKKELKLFIGIAYFQKEEFAECYRYLSEGYETGLDIGVQVQYLTFLGESAYKTDRIEEAFYYFEELLLLQPDNVMVKNNYSYYLSLEGKMLERAEELSRSTVEQFPENPVYLDTYAWILYKLGRYSEAKDFIKKAIDNDISDPDVYFHYAVILCRTGDREDSEKFFAKAKDAGYSDLEELESEYNSCVE